MNALSPTPLLATLCFLASSSDLCLARRSEPGRPPGFDPAKLAGVMEARVVGAGEKLFLPLRRTEIDVVMSGAVVETSVTQQFKNDTQQALEAIYLFPLPTGAAITGMELVVGDRVIRGRVMERELAKGVYELAKDGGVKTALLEQERPNLFTTSVANLLPGETVRVCFSYSHVAEYSHGKYALRIPMTHGPRYDPSDGSVADAARLVAPRIAPTVDPNHRVCFKLSIAGIPIGKVVSTTHEIVCRRPEGRPDECEVSLAKEIERADSDLELEIHIEKGKAPALRLVEGSGEAKGDPRHVLLSLFPPPEEAAEERVMKRDIVFVIDTSGSMGGEPIAQARAGLEKCLSMLGDDDAFTIVRFSSGFSQFTAGLEKATPEHLARAESFVTGLVAGGGTQMQPALGHALEIPGREDALRLVIFLTDGDVGNEQSLRRLVSEKLGRARLFTLGIGAAPNEFLMRKMAADGRGQARFIHSDNDIAGEIAALFGTLDKPVLTDIKLLWRGEGGELLDGVRSYPRLCPDVFHERPLQVVALLPAGLGGVTLELQGKTGEKAGPSQVPDRPGRGCWRRWEGGHRDAVRSGAGRRSDAAPTVRQECGGGEGDRNRDHAARRRLPAGDGVHLPCGGRQAGFAPAESPAH